jgi:hypothetical protein
MKTNALYPRQGLYGVASLVTLNPLFYLTLTLILATVFHGWGPGERPTWRIRCEKF